MDKIGWTEPLVSGGGALEFVTWPAVRSARWGALRGMLNCNGADVTLGVHIEKGVFIEVSGLDNRNISKLD